MLYGMGILVGNMKKEDKELLEYLKWYKQHIEHEKFMNDLLAAVKREEFNAYYDPDYLPKQLREFKRSFVTIGAPFK